MDLKLTFLVTSGSHRPHVIEEPLQQNVVHWGGELFCIIKLVLLQYNIRWGEQHVFVFHSEMYTANKLMTLMSE